MAGTREQALKNLKKRGADANPNGAPMFWETHEELYKKYSQMPLKELRAIDLDQVPIKQAIIINDLINARRGKDKSIDRFHNRTDGKAIERKEVSVKELPTPILGGVTKE